MTRDEMMQSLSEILGEHVGTPYEPAQVAREVLDHVDANRQDDELKMSELVVLAQHYEMLIDAAEERRDRHYAERFNARLEHLQRVIDERVGYVERAGRSDG